MSLYFSAKALEERLSLAASLFWTKVKVCMTITPSASGPASEGKVGLARPQALITFGL